MSLRCTLTLALWASLLVVSAQGTRTIDGRKYEVHVTQAGQTLYAIARTYAVPVDVLLAVNASANDGLSIGEEVLIPLDAVVKKERRTAPTMRNDGELLHTVRKKETLFGIARSYGMDMNALLERNPDAITLKEGMELVIPIARVSGASATVLAPALPADVVKHVVQPGETLFGLGQRYKVDPEVIRSANGGLPQGLKAGDTVAIPGGQADTTGTPVVKRIREQMRYKVGLLLPFAVQRNDSVLARASNEEERAFYEPTRIAVQFYNGALLAIDSMRALGLHADVEVMDLGDDMKTWGAALKKPEIDECDLFLGPFHRTAIEQLARINTHAHIVCPVPQSNKVILGMPTVSKVTPTRSDLLKHTARYVATQYARENIILARPDIASEKDGQEQARTALNESLVARSERLRDTVLLAKPGRRELGDLAAKLDANRLNVIVAPSEDVEFVTTLVGKLKPLATKYRILLVGMESWKEMPSVPLTDLDVLGFTFATASFSDPADPRLKRFTLAYRERFHADVDDYALLGFDVAFYYLKALFTEGILFPDHFAEVRTEPLHMGFRMTRTGPENGFRNEHAIMLQQKDLVLQKVP
ncbi:MAG: LysM peptidoglycan-binding domain-containing protein [Flavobacteriales bacterium]|nr:LysM peptidoglycan-binding domain-containing protein [Flavobacteriales bacterium]